MAVQEFPIQPSHKEMWNLLNLPLDGRWWDKYLWINGNKSTKRFVDSLQYSSNSKNQKEKESHSV